MRLVVIVGMDNDTIIQVDGLSKEYDLYKKNSDRVKEIFHPFRKKYHKKFKALDDVSFSVSRGEFFGIIGRNGSGKSTLLQLICGITKPTAGSVQARGRIAALLELGAGFNPEFTGRENVYLNGSILGFTRSEMDLIFDEILEFSEIGEFIDQPVKTYSSGMYLRLAFSVQACVEPEILIVDEALAVGDIFFRQKCYVRLRELLDKGCTVILVTHAMNDIEQLCQRALLLDHGKGVFLGSANEAVKRFYLLEQEQRFENVEPFLQTDQNTTDRLAVNNDLQDDLKGENDWPADEEFIDLSNIHDVSNGWVQCTGLAVCNKYAKRSVSFKQGDVVSFYYELKLKHDLEVPIAGIEFTNDKGVIVHGKTTLGYGTQVPCGLKSGQILRFRQDIKLLVAPGDYSFNLGFSCMGMSDFFNIGSMDHITLHSKIIRLCNLPNAGYFTVSLRDVYESVQLEHFGITDLPGSCRIVT